MIGLVAITLTVAAAPLAAWDFGTAPGDLVSEGDTQQWAWGPATTGPADNTPVWATVPDGDYLHASVDTLTLPALDLTGAERPILGIEHWYDIDPSGDIGRVEVARDGKWEALTPIYAPGPIISGASGGWVSVWFDLSDVHDTSEVRLAFESDASVSRPGWYISGIDIDDADIVPPQIRNPTDPGDTQDLTGPYRVEVTAEDDRTELWPEVLWQVDDAPVERARMTALDGDGWVANLPAQAPDSALTWWVEADDGVNTTALDPRSFRVFLAAPTDVAGPDARIVGHTAELTWRAPESDHTVIGYDVLLDGEVAAQSVLEAATVALTSDHHIATVRARYDTDLGEIAGDESAQVALDASLPQLDALSPNHAWQGDTVYVQISGEYLLLTQADAELDLGPGVSILNVDVIDVDRARFTAQIDPDAPVGPRSATLWSGGEALPSTLAFSVLDGEDRPALREISPERLRPGRETTLTLTLSEAPATDLPPLLDLGEGVLIGDVEIVGDTVTASIAITPDAPLGQRAVTLDDGTRIWTGAEFTVFAPAPPPATSCGCALAPGRPPPPIWWVPLALLVWRRRTP